MQVITTKIMSVTNTKGQRVKAVCSGDSITIGWEYAVGHTENHRLAAEALRHKLGWSYLMVSGVDHRGDGQHILLHNTQAQRENGRTKYRPYQLEQSFNISDCEYNFTTFKVGDSKYMNIRMDEITALIDLFNQNDIE